MTSNSLQSKNSPHDATPRVLIVDDDPHVLNVVALALAQKDCECTKTSSAVQALTVLRNAPKSFDLMIIDVRLPGMNGFDITRRALELNPDLTVLTMSALTELQTPVEAIRAGSADYLQKPFQPSDLLACVDRLVSKRHAAFERKRTEAQIENWDSAARALSLSLNARDKETEGHAERVLAYSIRLGREVGLSNDQMIALEFGARLHDVGKIAVPDNVLKKPGDLNDEEWLIMEKHPTIGQQMVLSMNLPADAAAIVGQHHERWDGSGYPLKLRGEQIHIGARVFSVVDAFDAITSDRCYRRAQTYEAALDELRKYAGIQFDPDVVKAFASVDPAVWLEIRSRCPADAFPEASVA
jgi:response regulator RpfG family c-di-GMP phosphodiesterase